MLNVVWVLFARLKKLCYTQEKKRKYLLNAGKLLALNHFYSSEKLTENDWGLNVWCYMFSSEVLHQCRKQSDDLLWTKQQQKHISTTENQNGQFKWLYLENLLQRCQTVLPSWPETEVNMSVFALFKATKPLWQNGRFNSQSAGVAGLLLPQSDVVTSVFLKG